MRLHSVLEPSVLQAPDQEWSDPKFRLRFETRLLELRDSVVNAKGAGCDYQVLVSDKLRVLIWDGGGPAWLRHRDYMGQALNVTLGTVMNLARVVEPSGPSLLVDPPLEGLSADDLWLETTLELLTWAASQSETLVIDVGIDGSPAREASLLRDGAVVRVVPLCHDRGESLEALERSLTPADLVSALRLVEGLYPSAVVVLDEAYRSAEDYDFEPGKALRIVLAMAQVLPKLHFEDASVDIEKEFEEQTGFKLAMTDTKLTKQDKKAIAQRQRTYGGRVIDITPHVKAGNSKTEQLLRVHYHPDHETRRIVIGHCGGHLHTAGARYIK
jgi:hypothetical protein